MSDFIETNTNDDGIVGIGNSGSQKRRKFMSHSVSTEHFSWPAALLACRTPGIRYSLCRVERDTGFCAIQTYGFSLESTRGCAFYRPATLDQLLGPYGAAHEPVLAQRRWLGILHALHWRRSTDSPVCDYSGVGKQPGRNPRHSDWHSGKHQPNRN